MQYSEMMKVASVGGTCAILLCSLAVVTTVAAHNVGSLNRLKRSKIFCCFMTLLHVIPMAARTQIVRSYSIYQFAQLFFVKINVPSIVLL